MTGSARLDNYRRGGDSLLGRYHFWRLHPIGFDEIPQDLTPEEGLRRLLTSGGFPEPFLGGDEREARRWLRERSQKVLRDVNKNSFWHEISMESVSLFLNNLVCYL